MNPFERYGTSYMSEEKLKHEAGENRRFLKELEATGLYVFHGSSNPDIAKLEPRQAEDWKTGERVEHGEPAVCATPFADLAIFRAMVNTGWSSFGTTDDEDGIYCAATDKAMETAKKAKGYVYVMAKSDFEVFEGGSMEVRSHSTVKPNRVVEVAFDDLPPGIRVLDDEGHLTPRRWGDKL